MRRKTFILIHAFAMAIAMASAHADPIAMTLGKTYSGGSATCPGDTAPVATYTYDLSQNATPHLSFLGTSEGHSEVADTAPGATGNVWKPSYRVHVSGEAKDLDITGENASIDITPAAGKTSVQLDIYAYNCSADYAPKYQIRVQPTSIPLADISGKVTFTNGAAWQGVAITAYDQDGVWYGSTVTDKKGNYDIQVDPGLYFVEYSNGLATTWNGGMPRSKATAINTINGSVVKNVSLSDANPQIISLAGNYAASLPITLYGVGFGSKIGYLDFGGNLQNSASTVVSAWSDRQITATVPQGTLPTYIRVFSNTGGWSDKHYPQGFDLPIASPSSDHAKVVKGNPFTLTVTFDKPPVVNNQQVNITWGGTAKQCTTLPSNACDYYVSGGIPKVVSIPSGQTQAQLYVTTVSLLNNGSAGNRTVTMTLAKGTGYKVATPSKVSVTLTDK
jgi:type 1 fimbria pilin